MKAIKGINCIKNSLSINFNKKAIDAMNKVNLSMNKKCFHNVTRTDLKNKLEKVFI